MKELDRLGWVAAIGFRAYGVRIGIRSNDPQILQESLQHLPPHWKLDSSTLVDHLYSLIRGGTNRKSRIRRFNVLYSGPFRLARSMDLKEVLEIFENDLQVHLAVRARTRLFVHAGVVGWNGQAILIPGSSHSGKTTLVAALVQRGATYYSDEYAVLDRKGRVHPYPRPLSVRRGPKGVSRRVSADTFEAIPGEGPIPARLIVLTRYGPGKIWRPRLVSPGQAVLGLLSHTVAARSRPRSSLAILRRVATRARTLRGVRGEASQAAEAILKEVGGGRLREGVSGL